MDTQDNIEKTADHLHEHAKSPALNRTPTQLAFELILTEVKRRLTPNEWKQFKTLSPEAQARGFIDAYQFGLKPKLGETGGPRPVTEQNKTADIVAWENLGKEKLKLAPVPTEPVKTLKIEAGVPIPPVVSGRAAVAATIPKIEAAVPIPPIQHRKHAARKVDPKSPRGLLNKLAKANIGDSILLVEPKTYKGTMFPRSMDALARDVAGPGWFTMRTMDAHSVRMWKTGEPTKKN